MTPDSSSLSASGRDGASKQGANGGSDRQPDGSSSHGANDASSRGSDAGSEGVRRRYERTGPRAGRGVLLIGCTSPIGLAIARAFAADGDRVAGVALQESGDPAFAAAAAIDCATSAGAASAVDFALQRLGRLDVLVLAAAVMPVAPATEQTDDEWRAAVDVTLSGAFYACRAALPHLPRGGTIVAITSVNSFLAAPGLPGYAAAKAGLDGLVRQLALEYGPRGIRVNSVAPGMIGGEHLPNVNDGYPLGRVGHPDEVAAAVSFLASPAAGFITGVCLPVDGGLSIASPAAFLRPDLRARWLAS